jgi:inner membrane protein
MMGMSHAAFGLFLYGLVGGMFGDVTLSCLAVAVLFALIPDVDQPQSALGMILFSLSRWINKKYGHRTVTHGLRFLVIMSDAALPLILIDWMYWLAVPVGIFAHLMSDGMTESGVPLLYPNPTPFFFLPERMLIKTGAVHEIAFFAIFMMLAAMFAGVSYIGGSVSIIAKIMPSFMSIQKQYISQYDGAGERELCYVSGYYIPISKKVEGICTGSDGYDLIIRTNQSYYLLGKSNTDKLKLRGGEKENVTISERRLENTLVSALYEGYEDMDVPVIVTGELHGEFYTLENLYPEVIKVSGNKVSLNHVLLSDLNINGYVEVGKVHYKVLNPAAR